MPKSPYLEQAQLNVLHGTAHPNPATFYAGLFTTLPGNDQWTLSVNQATGSLTLTFGGQVTSSLTGSSTAAQVQAALQALSSIGANSCVVTGLNGETDAALPGDTLLINLNGALGWAANGNITKTDTTLVSTLTHTVTGSAGVEPTGGGYARVSFPTLATAIGNGTSNSGIVSFGASSGAYSPTTQVGWGIWDAAAAGHCWYADAFAGINDIWTLSYTFTTAPTGGSFTTTLTGTNGNEIGTSSAIPWNADALTLQSILEEMAGAGNVQVRATEGGKTNLPPTASGGPGMTITFIGALRFTAQTLAIGVNSLTGGTGTPTPVLTHATTGASGNQVVGANNITPQFAAAALTIFEGSPLNPSAVVV